MPSYLRSFADLFLKHLSVRSGEEVPRESTPVIRNVRLDRSPRRKPQPPADPDPSDLRVGGLPPGTKIVSNGNGKNVYSGAPLSPSAEKVLSILDDPSLSLEEDEASFDPYNSGNADRPRSWDKVGRNRHS